jgi:predicted CoA-binding protein
MQDGAGNAEAAGRAEEAGLVVVMDDCMLRQHRRLFA